MISPFVGWFIDKFGPRNVMLFGIFLTGFGFILLSRINALWQFYASFVIITLGLSFGTFLVVTTTVANWFVRQRSKAMSITMAGSGLGGMLVPLIVWMIATTDWRTGLVIIGVGFWVMGIPVSFVMRRRPEDYGMLPDGDKASDQSEANVSSGESSVSAAQVEAAGTFTAKQALRTRTFWQLSLAMGASQLVMSASLHHIPAVTSFGMSREIGGLMILVVSVFSVIGRLASGVVGDAMDKRKVIAISFVLQFLGTLIFAFSTNVWHLIIFSVLWGLGFGGSIPVRFAMIADLFGRRYYGSIMGTLMTVSSVFGVAGPVFVGWMADSRGNYREPFFLIAASVIISIPLILTLSTPKKKQTTP